MLIPVVARAHHAQIVDVNVVHTDAHLLAASIAGKGNGAALARHLQGVLNALLNAGGIHHKIHPFGKEVLHLGQGILLTRGNGIVGTHLPCHRQSGGGGGDDHRFAKTHGLGGGQHAKTDRSRPIDHKGLPKGRIGLFQRAKCHAKGLAQGGHVKGNVIGLFTKSVNGCEKILTVSAVAPKADLLKLLTIAPVAAAAGGAFQANDVAAADHGLANPALVGGVTHGIHNAAPLVPRDQGVIGGNVAVDHLQIGGADGGGLDLDTGKAGGRGGQGPLTKGDLTRLFYNDSLHK